MSRVTKVGALSAILIAGLLAAPATAADGASNSVVTKVESRRIAAAEIASAERATPIHVARQLVERHVAAEAKRGRFIDAKSVRAAAVRGGEVTWERGSVIDELRLDRYEIINETGQRGELLELALLSAEEDSVSHPLASAGGAGMGNASYSGGTKLADYCQYWSSNGNSIDACVEKFKPTRDGSSSRDYYLYNRHGTAAGKIVDWAPDWKVTKFDMRSRPREGYESRTKGQSGYFPIDSTKLCDEGGSVSIARGSLTLSIPLTNCSEKYPVPDSTAKQMGLVYDAGAVFETRVKGLDYEQEVWTYEDYTSPSLGFYNYAKFCQYTYATCHATIGTDGW